MMPYLGKRFDYEFYHIRAITNLNYYIDYATTYAKLVRKLLEKDYDGLIVWNYYYVPLIAKRKEKKIVDITDITHPITHNRRIKGLTVDTVENHFMASMDLIIVQVVEKLREYVSTYKDSLVRYVPNGVDTEAFKPDVNIKKEFYCCFLGKIEEQYHIKEIIGAIAISGVKGLFIGGGRDLDEYASCAKERGANITFQGYVPHEEVPCLLNKCRFGLQPTKHGGPLKLYEYLACGLPVISRQSVDETIKEGVYLAPEETEEQYAEILSKLAGMSDSEYSRVSRKCRSESLAFSLDVMGKKYCDAIAEVLG